MTRSVVSTPNPPSVRSAGAAAIWWWASPTARSPQHFKRDVQEMFEWVQQGKLRPHISARYPLAQGAQAITDMMNRKVMGKVVITA